jgi:hypothetical protein
VAKGHSSGAALMQGQAAAAVWLQRVCLTVVGGERGIGSDVGERRPRRGSDAEAGGGELSSSPREGSGGKTGTPR